MSETGMATRDVEAGLSLIDLARSDVAAFSELLRPVGVRDGERHLSLTFDGISLGAINRDLIGPWIDDEEKVPSLTSWPSVKLILSKLEMTRPTPL